MTHSFDRDPTARRAIPGDAKSIASIHVRSWQEAYKGVVRSTSFREITLWVLEKNTGACRFYENLGFSVDPGHEKTLERGRAQLVEIRLHRALRFSSDRGLP